MDPRACSHSSPASAGFFFTVERTATKHLARPSGRVSGIKRRRGLQLAVFRHGRGVGNAFLAARSEMLAGDVVLAWPILFTILAYLGLLTNGLNHGFFTLRTPQLRISRNLVPIHSRFAAAGGASIGDVSSIFGYPTFLFRAIPSLNSGQCRVPPSPPAIRDMKKPRQRKFAGASDSEACPLNSRRYREGEGARRRTPASPPAQYLVMSFVSGRTKPRNQTCPVLGLAGSGAPVAPIARKRRGAKRPAFPLCCVA